MFVIYSSVFRYAEREGTDLEGFIDHDSIAADDPSFYHVVNQQIQEEAVKMEESSIPSK